jgi:hypothetical protein
MIDKLLAVTSVVGLSAVIACGAAPTDAPVHVFQIAGIRVAPSLLFCAGAGYGYELRLNIDLVNTTPEDVVVESVRSSGVVIRTTNGLDVSRFSGNVTRGVGV